MNDIKIFNNDQFGEIRTIVKNGEPLFVLKDVCNVFGEQNYRRVAQRLDEDEKGVSQINTPGGAQNMTLVTEAGLYTALFNMQPTKARGVSDEYIEKRCAELKAFKRWVTHDVLPAIRKTGKYETKPMTDYQQMMDETRRKNASIQTARLLMQLANQYDGTYRDVLNAHAAKELTGDFLLPLPQLEEKTYSAGEIGEMLGVSANKVGILANRNGLKTKEYGKWFHDKSRYSSKEVQSFRYFERVIPVLQRLLAADPPQ